MSLPPHSLFIQHFPDRLRLLAAKGGDVELTLTSEQAHIVAYLFSLGAPVASLESNPGEWMKLFAGFTAKLEAARSAEGIVWNAKGADAMLEFFDQIGKSLDAATKVVARYKVAFDAGKTNGG